ncbi:MAG TPA: Hsp20/alpha crystallin family protein [Desulfobacteraceae bacterium]|nr:Hsp20/alpha crystallin family protein [Desulfobacteraceae bacterium]
MAGLILWKDREISRLRREIDRLFSQIFDEFSVPIYPRSWKRVPYVDISETEDYIYVHAEIPGIQPEDLDISIQHDVLEIKGIIKREWSEEYEGYRRVERQYGSFSRKIPLPCPVAVDEVKANYKNGILEIEMPKLRKELKRRIPIEVV